MSDVAAWAAGAVTQLNADQQHFHESIPIDYLLGSSFAPDRVVEQALSTYRELLRAGLSWAELAMPRLSFMLPETATFAGVDSVGENILEEIDEFQLPRFFLSLRTLSAFLFAPGWEEYRAPVPVDVPELAGPLPVVATYVCYRNESARANGEFYRGLWLDQHPWPRQIAVPE